MKKLLFFVLMLTTCLFPKIVLAEAYLPKLYQFAGGGIKDGNEGLPSGVWVNSPSSTYGLDVYSSQNIEINLQNYVVLTTCIANWQTSNYISISNGSMNGAFANGRVDVLDTRIPCVTRSPDNTFYGYYYKLYLKIYKWAIPSGGADVYHAGSNMHLYHNYQWAAFFELVSIEIYEKSTYLEDSMKVSNNTLIINNHNQIIQKHNETITKIDGVKGSVDDVKDSIKDENVDNPSSKIDEFVSKLPQNGVITNLITLPVTLFTKILNNINSSCTNFDLGIFLGTNLIFPCINISNYLGSNLVNIIDILFSGLFVFVISKKMIKAFNNFSSMEEGDVING